MRMPLPTTSPRLLRPAIAAAAVFGALLFAQPASATLQYTGWNDYWDQSPKAAQLAAGLGANAARPFACWCSIEGTRGRYDWSYLDRANAVLTANHMKPLIVVIGSPSWAHGSVNCAADSRCLVPPDASRDGDWQNFVKAVAQRYPNALGIEVWNEPNLSMFWAPHPNPIRYTTLLKEAYSAVKSAVPSMPVVAGGLAGTLYPDAGGYT